MSRRRRFDVVVIGAGTAGLVAATALAQRGAEVCVVAKGVGSTHLAPGTIDVLGYAPERVDNPALAIRELAAASDHPAAQTPHPAAQMNHPAARADRRGAPTDHPAAQMNHPAAQVSHPYALIGAETVSEAVGWLIATAAAGPAAGYEYVGSLERNFLLPTAAGALKPSAVIPQTFAAGDAEWLGRLAVVGLPGLRDFHAGLCAANLVAAGIDAYAVTFEPPLERADTNTLGLARLLDDRSGRASFSAGLAPLVRGAEQVALPAILGLKDPRAVLGELEQRLGARVFEIPTLPPSVPGMRLFELLAHSLRAAGGRLVLGAGVVGHVIDGERISSVQTRSAGSPTTYEADAFVLASGGFHSGAITLDSYGQAREQVLGLPLHGLPADGEPKFAAAYFSEQPIARAGVAVDAELRAVGAANVLVAGASLPGAVPWLEASGEGIALASGYRAAQVLAGRLSTRMQAIG